MKVAGEIETYSPRVCQCGHLEKDHDLYDAVSRKRMDCLVGVFKGMEIDAKPCPCSNFSLVHVGQLSPSIEDAKQWKNEQSGIFISPELEDYVAKLMSDYAMEVLARYLNSKKEEE